MSTFRYGKTHPSSCIDHILHSCRVWWSFQSLECFAALTDVLIARHKLFHPRTSTVRWQQGESEAQGIEMRKEKSAGGGERGVLSVSETLCHGLDEEMKCAASIRRWAKIKARPTLSHMVLFDQCFAFSLFAFFSRPLSRIFLLFWEQAFCFFPSEIPPRYWGNNAVARKVRGLRKPNLPQILWFTLISPTFLPFFLHSL